MMLEIPLQTESSIQQVLYPTVNSSLQNLYTNTQKQIDQLLDMRLKNLVSDEEYQQKKDLLLLEKKEINEKLGKTDERANNWLELSEKTFNFATYSRYWFNNGTTQQKREILSTLGSNLMIKDQKLSLYLHKPFTIISEMQEKINVLLDLFEPEEIIDISGYPNEAIPSLLGGRDSNPDKLLQRQLYYRYTTPHVKVSYILSNKRVLGGELDFIEAFFLSEFFHICSYLLNIFFR